MLKNEPLLAVGIVIVIAEPLETLLHRDAFFKELDKGLFGRIGSEDWQFLFANIAIGVFARYLYRLVIGGAFFDVETHDRVFHLAV